MIYNNSIISVLDVLIVVVPVLLSVAFVTVAERKTMASMQRRLGPNVVGYYGSLQAFADALKLLLKEYVSPTQANNVLFFLGPIITLIFSLLGYAVIPFGPGVTVWDFNLGIIYMLAVSSLATYGILLAGWSANSKYAFLGSLRSSAQLISYELILSSVILIVILLTSSLNLTIIIEFQKSIWYVVPLLPIALIFFIGSIAETNRPPFDLAEAESELVSGFMTEHAAVIFVFFFLAEYASIVLICILSTVLFLGGYNYHIIGEGLGLVNTIFEAFLVCINIVMDWLIYLFSLEFNSKPDISISSAFSYSNNIKDLSSNLELTKHFANNNYLQNLIDFNLNSNFPSYYNLSDYPSIQGLLYGLTLGIKSIILIFTFIWVRASFPRIRYDQLMSFSWTVLLPLIIGFIIAIPCIIYSFDLLPTNFTVF